MSIIPSAPGEAGKVCSGSSSHFLPRFSPSPHSTHQIYWFSAFPRNWIHPPPSQEFSPATPERTAQRFYDIYTLFSSTLASPGQMQQNTNPMLITPNWKKKKINSFETNLNQFQKCWLLFCFENHLTLVAFEIVSVVSSVVWNPQVVGHPDFVLQEPKLKTLKARGCRQIFSVHTNKH